MAGQPPALQYHTFTTGYQSDTTPAQEDVRDQVNRDPPVDCYGEAGDIVFWHHRMGHMAGHNYSRAATGASITRSRPCY